MAERPTHTEKGYSAATRRGRKIAMVAGAILLLVILVALGVYTVLSIQDARERRSTDARLTPPAGTGDLQWTPIRQQILRLS